MLGAQARALRPEVVAIGDPALAPALSAAVPKGTEVLTGPEGLAAVARLGDVVLNAVVGFAGLPVTLAALEAGHRLALANKESLIAGAPVVARAKATPGAEIVPVDSEHCALHQCLRAGNGPDEVARLVLTASGGPFRGRTSEELAGVGVEEALAHPTWRMGPKITVDSSTLMNKGLEVIEAHELFGVDYDRIAVIIHPQSVVHSMVEFIDGSTVAQLSQPDMRLPIGYALGYPHRLRHPFGAIDWSSLGPARFRAARPQGLRLPRPRRGGGPGRGPGPGVAQRRQRGRGGRLPGRAHRLGRHRRGGGRHPGRVRRGRCRPTPRTSSRPTGAPASGPSDSVRQREQAA